MRVTVWYLWRYYRWRQEVMLRDFSLVVVVVVFPLLPRLLLPLLRVGWLVWFAGLGLVPTRADLCKACCQYCRDDRVVGARSRRSL